MAKTPTTPDDMGQVRSDEQIGSAAMPIPRSRLMMAAP
jgi:hypothetical protein